MLEDLKLHVSVCVSGLEVGTRRGRVCGTYIRTIRVRVRVCARVSMPVCTIATEMHMRMHACTHARMLFNVQ